MKIWNYSLVTPTLKLSQMGVITKSMKSWQRTPFRQKFFIRVFVAFLESVRSSRTLLFPGLHSAIVGYSEGRSVPPP